MYYQLGIALNVQLGDARSLGYEQSSDQDFVFSLVIGSTKRQDKSVFELVTVRGDEDTAGSNASVDG